MYYQYMINCCVIYRIDRLNFPKNFCMKKIFFQRLYQTLRYQLTSVVIASRSTFYCVWQKIFGCQLISPGFAQFSDPIHIWIFHQDTRKNLSQHSFHTISMIFMKVNKMLRESSDIWKNSNCTLLRWICLAKFWLFIVYFVRWAHIRKSSRITENVAKVSFTSKIKFSSLFFTFALRPLIMFILCHIHRQYASCALCARHKI